jgi:hypothetical protein
MASSDETAGSSCVRFGTVTPEAAAVREMPCSHKPTPTASSPPAASQLGTPDTGGYRTVGCGAVECIVGHLVTSLASVH